MDEIWSLLLLCLAMLCGCYIAGIIPLLCSFSEDRLKLVTVLGAGLLIGTSLSVIIPEAVHAMYSSKLDIHHNVNEPGRSSIKASLLSSKKDSSVKILPEKKPHPAESSPHTHSFIDTHTIIGVSLVIGFIFMLIIDQLSGGSHHHPTPGSNEAQQSTLQRRNKMTATLGLVVHATADGVALGAAVNTTEMTLTVIVFLAIMLHKAPAAFGLVSFLLHDGLDRMRIKKHLLVFSLAAPISAIFTFFVLHQTRASLTHFNMTGVAMLFSAGTFLYVATVHILPEIVSSRQVLQNTNGNTIQRDHKGLRISELLVLVAGSLIPLFLTLGHKH